MHSSASRGLRSRINVRPSLDDKILARVRIDSASSSSSAHARALFQNPLKSVAIAVREGRRRRWEWGEGNSWGASALRSCHEETHNSQPHRVLKGCTPGVAESLDPKSDPVR